MPIEVIWLEGSPVPIEVCPKCGKKFRPFLRGQVQRWPWRFILWWPRPYCALICWECKNIVGYE